MSVRAHGMATLIVAAALPIPGRVGAAAQSTGGSRAGPPPHAAALAAMGGSGLRGLLSASGSIGDLQNRAGSYGMAVQLEGARVGGLEGRLGALDAALADPELPSGERNALMAVRAATVAELETVPRYEAAYEAGTAQAESLLPVGFIGNRPLFLLVRGRVHVRGGGADGLTVFSEAVSAGPVLMASDRWIISPGLVLGRTDVRIEPFDGSSAATSLGPQLSVGFILGRTWGAAVQVGRFWAHGRSVLLRPGPGDPVEVRTESWSETTTAQAELQGRLSAGRAGGLAVAVRPRVGAFFLSRYSPAATNSLGETGSGPFGARETLAALRVGSSLEARIGPWGPVLYAGWERELTDQLSIRVEDPHALHAAAGVSRTWGRGRRVALDYTLLLGIEGARRVSELALVVILDG
jgi:hypothetical protein